MMRIPGRVFIFIAFFCISAANRCFSDMVPVERPPEIPMAGEAASGGMAAEDRYISPLEWMYIGLEEGLLKTKREIDPYVWIEERYEDNLFNTKSDKEPDLVTHIIPGIRYNFTPKIDEQIDAGVNLDFQGDIKRYQLHPYLDTTVWNNLFGKVSTDFFLDRARAYYKMERSYELAADIYPDSDTSPADRDREVIYWLNNFGASYTLGAGRYTIPVSYDHEDQKFLSTDDKANDFARDTFDLKIYSQLLSDMTGYVGGVYSMVGRFKRQDANNIYKRVHIGLDGYFSPKIKGTVSAGRTMIDSETSGTSASNSTGNESSMDMDVDIEYVFDKRLSLFFRGSQTTQDTAESSAANAQTNYYGFGAPEGLSDVNEQYSTTRRLSLQARYLPAIDDKLAINGGVDYNDIVYASGTEDKIYDINISASYRVKKWVSLVLGYSHRLKESLVGDQQGYEANTYRLNLTMEF